MQSPWFNQLRSSTSIIIGTFFLTLCGCVSPEQHQAATDRLAGQVENLESQLQATQESLQQLSAEELESRKDAATQLSELRDEMAALPDQLSGLCPQPVTSVNPICDEPPPVETVVMLNDKMVVGELERVWVDPPGSSLIARMDTGAASSSLHAEDIVKFERDGDDWVRFKVIVDEEIETLERKVERYVRVYQQADPEGSRRPVVLLRLRLGDVQDTFEFTLADRAHLEYQFLLGRNFLTDIAVVDVSKQFVQPRYTPPKN